MLGGRKSQSNKPKSQKQTASAPAPAPAVTPVAAPATTPAPQTKPVKASVKQTASVKAQAVKAPSIKSESAEKPVKKQPVQSTKQPAAKSEPKPSVEAPKSTKPSKSTKQAKTTPSKAPQKPKQEVEPMQMDESDDQPDVDMKPQSKPRQSRAAKRANTKVEPVVADDDMSPSESAPVEIEERGVVYLGRLPHGMFEKQLRAFLIQFGDIKHLKLSRNKKTGKSKHYAFVEFEHASVAQVVADAMHRYMMYGHTLEAHVVPTEKLHPELFKDAEKGFRHIPYAKISRAQYNRPRSGEEQQVRISKLLQKEELKRQSLRQAGIDFDFAGFRAELTPAV